MVAETAGSGERIVGTMAHLAAVPLEGSLTLALLPNLGPLEIGAILVIGLLLFGRRLPEVGRNVGRSIIEFKRGLRDVSSELEAESRKDSSSKPASLNEPTDSRTVSQSTQPVAEPAAQSPSASPASGEADKPV